MKHSPDKPSRWLAPACALGLASPVISDGLAGFSGTGVWLVDLASHWQWLYLAGLILACSIAIFTDRRWAWWLLAAPLPWLSASQPAPDAETVAPRLFVVASANVHMDNPDISALVRWLEKTRPDVAVLQEISPAHARQLDALNGYPFRHIVPSLDPFGMAILSRHPLSLLPSTDHPASPRQLEVRLDWNKTPIKLAAWHPMPPITSSDHTIRNQQLRALADSARSSKLPSIVVGDLNASPWSNAFSGIDQAGLRRATGLTPTWPAVGQGWMGIPIDHVLVTSHWSVVSRALGPDLGSDHLPVLVRIGLVSREATSKDHP